MADAVGATGALQLHRLNLTGSAAFPNGTAIGTLGSITGGSSYTVGTIIQALSTLVGGSSYVQGHYTGVPLTGGAGTNATATIDVNAAGAVAAVALTSGGSGYLLNDTLSASNANLGGAGSGFTITVSQVGYNGVALTGGLGSGATANISVSAGGAVTVVSLVARGSGYALNDTLSATAASIGGTGSGFSVPVASIGSVASIQNNLFSIGSDSAGAAYSGTWIGNGLVGQPCLNLFWMTDTVDCATAASQGLAGNSIVLSAKNTAKGSRVAMSSLMVAQGPTGPYGYTAASMTSQSATNLGGTGGGGQGSLFGNNPLVWAQNGATYLLQVCGEEIDIAVSAGASTQDRIGLQIVKTTQDAVKGTRTDVALQIADQATSPVAPWVNAITFGSKNAAWPFDVNSTLLAGTPRTIGPTGANNGIAGIGIDFSTCTFGTGPIMLPGGPRILSGSGSPAGVISAPIGAMYLRIDGATGSTLYVKEAGAGNSGWTAK